MDQFIINGGQKLEGEVEILGVKNGILPMMAASILASKGKTIIRNVPHLRDVITMSEVLKSLGAKTEYDQKERTLNIDCQSIHNYRAPYDLVKQMRASFLVIGPLLARFKKAEVSLPGGCSIGARAVDMHLNALMRMGATLEDREGYIVGDTNGLKGITFYFDFPTHTGTENIMMAACLAHGETQIVNAACEPEIVDLANMLNGMGAKIRGAGTPIITIDGVDSLYGIEYTAIPSRIETAFFMAAAAMTGGEIVLKNAILSNMGIVVNKMRDMGIQIVKIDNNTVLVKRERRMKAINFTTRPFPGFPTDFQAPMMALLTVSEGTSIIEETIFEKRFMHISELKRMGANIVENFTKAVLVGVNCLTGASVMCSDLQAGAALVIAALGAEGRTTIDRVYHIDRGYERLEERLSKLGASIKRINPVDR